MKKLFLMFAMLGMAAAVSAQEKGDMYIKGSFGISGGNTKDISIVNGSSTTQTRPSSVNFDLAPEFGIFVADNVKVALELSYSLGKSPNGTAGDKKLYTFNNNFYITPNVSYYVKLAERFYYTPGVDLFLGFGNSKSQIDATNTKKAYSKTSLGFALNLLEFEFRVSKHFALSAEFGGLYFSSVSTKTSDTSKSVSNYVDFSIYEASLGFQYYF